MKYANMGKINRLYSAYMEGFLVFLLHETYKTMKYGKGNTCTPDWATERPIF